MDRRTIVVFLYLKELSAKTRNVHIELVPIFGSDAIACSTVTKYLQNSVILQKEPEDEDRAEDQGFSVTDNAILEALEIMSFASISWIAQMTFIPPTIRFRRLMKSLHFVLKRLPWIPH
jgi:hypothetical protein